MALLWRQAKNPTYTDKVLSSVENKIEKNTWYQKWVSELSQVVWPVFYHCFEWQHFRAEKAAIIERWERCIRLGYL